MQRTKKFILLLIALLIIMVSIPVLGVIVCLKDETRIESISNPCTSVSHPPIIINNNTELDTFCFGQGTDGMSWLTAHVIEDYEIDAGGSGAALFIQNTNLFLIIRNITATDAGASVDAGILLKNCTNVKITNCTAHNNGFHGISIQETSNSFLLDNTAFSNPICGLDFYESYNIRISENNANNNDFHGITIWGGNNNTISDNIFEYNDQAGITLFRTENNTCSGNAISNNLQDGIRIIEADENIIKNNNVTQSQYGVYLEDAESNIIEKNTIFNNSLSGVFLKGDSFYSRYNVIRNNTITHNNEYGINLYYTARNNEIYYNSLCYNVLGDISDLGANNNIHDNYDCTPVTPSEAIMGYPFLWILGFVMFGCTILVFKSLKNNKRKK
ncbi:MAG: nitrous oxide reductase family maturation protein NosD [Candidatus Hermodarchaeota archaeon]